MGPEGFVDVERDLFCTDPPSLGGGGLFLKNSLTHRLHRVGGLTVELEAVDP